MCINVLFRIICILYLIQISSSAVCNFGPGCPFPCHCHNEGPCDSVSGTCTTGICKVASPTGYGWSGPGCLTGNVAVGKSASQNGVYGGRLASLAVDGDDLVEYKAACAHTDSPRSGSLSCPSNRLCGHSWWQVDLEKLHRVSGITIFNVRAPDESFRMNHIRLYVSNTSRVLSGRQCNSFNHTMYSGENRTFTCTRPLIGRYVTLYKYDTTTVPNDNIRIFTVCEVVVIGNIYNDCTTCTSSSGVCTEKYGCVRCPPGLQPDSLCTTECGAGYFGPSCSTPCGKCDGSEPCDEKTGSCPGQCQQWWTSEQCRVQIKLPESDNNTLIQSYVSDTFVVLVWSGVQDIPEMLRPHYGYKVLYRRVDLDNTGWITHTKRTHTAINVYMVTVPDLLYNTRYVFQVLPYRLDRGQTGYGTQMETFIQTECSDPDKPSIVTIKAGPPANITTIETIHLQWKLPQNTGCDSIQNISIQYISDTGDNTRGYPGSTTSAVLEVDDPGEYTIHVVVYNNKGLHSTSETQRIAIDRIDWNPTTESIPTISPPLTTEPTTVTKSTRTLPSMPNEITKSTSYVDDVTTEYKVVAASLQSPQGQCTLSWALFGAVLGTLVVAVIVNIVLCVRYCPRVKGHRRYKSHDFVNTVRDYIHPARGVGYAMNSLSEFVNKAQQLDIESTQSAGNDYEEMKDTIQLPSGFQYETLA